MAPHIGPLSPNYHTTFLAAQRFDFTGFSFTYDTSCGTTTTGRAT